jgi:hypothetical protein
MRQQTGKVLADSATLVSVSELAEIIGVGIDTINNWIRHDIISRVRMGGRQLRARLFSTEEVYKTALINELVELGIAPSSARDAVDAIWKEWAGTEVPKGWLFAAVLPVKGKWTAALCLQRTSAGPLYKVGRSGGTRSVQMELPKQAFAMIPISHVFERVSSKMSGLVGG